MIQKFYRAILEIDQMEKILVVHNRYQMRGGEDTVVENEIAMLRKYGHFVLEYYRDNSEVNQYSKFNKLLVPFNSIFNISVYRDIKKIIMSNNIDIVHVHNTHLIISPAVFYAAVKCKVPVVMTMHNFRLLCASALLYRNGVICEQCLGGNISKGVRYKCFQNSKAKSLMLVANNMLHRLTKIYKKVNFIALTEFNVSKLCCFNQISREQIYIKPNFTIGPDRNIIMNKDRDYYIYFGRLDKSKGVDLIFDAFVNMPDKKLIIAGEGPLYNDFRQVIEKKDIKNIELVGFCNRQKLEDLLIHAKASIVASKWYETFGMTVIEAFSYGTPVISGNIGNMASLIEDGYNGLIYNIYTEGSLESAVHRFGEIEDDNLRINAYNTYETKYSEETNYTRLISIYHDMIEKAKV